MTHECFSENVLLIPRISRQLFASEDQKSVQNSRYIGRVAHDSNRIARNRLDTSQIKPQRRGTRYFCSRSISSHYHTVRTKLTPRQIETWNRVSEENTFKTKTKTKTKTLSATIKKKPNATSQEVSEGIV